MSDIVVVRDTDERYVKAYKTEITGHIWLTFEGSDGHDYAIALTPDEIRKLYVLVPPVENMVNAILRADQSELAKAWDEGYAGAVENVNREIWEDGEQIVNPYRRNT